MYIIFFTVNTRIRKNVIPISYRLIVKISLQCEHMMVCLYILYLIRKCAMKYDIKRVQYNFFIKVLLGNTAHPNSFTPLKRFNAIEQF